MRNINNRVDDWFNRGAKGEASSVPTDELQRELERRMMQNVFPLEVFHPKARDFATNLHQHMDVPRAFVGLTMLAVYSSAIGTAYGILRSGKPTYMCIWGCLYGMSSSGKSLALDILYDPLFKIQDELDRQYAAESRANDLVESKTALMRPRLRTAVYRESHIPTLMREVMPENPKGVTKHVDEMVEWVNGFNALANKEGTDEQFWLSAWNTSSYSAIRSGGKKYTTPRVFVNVVGGVQSKVAWKLFRNDRAVTGFIFRVLFAVLEENRIALPELGYELPKHQLEEHNELISRLWRELPVNDGYEPPRLLTPCQNANKLLDKWKRDRAHRINNMEDELERSVHAGILGKVSEYALRFAGLLAVTDLVYENRPFGSNESIAVEHAERAIKLADYFYESAWKVYSEVDSTIVAPVEVIQIAGRLRRGMSISDIARLELSKEKGTEEAKRKKMSRIINRMKAKYPRAFGALEQS